MAIRTVALTKTSVNEPKPSAGKKGDSPATGITKAAKVLRLLSTKRGATIADLRKETGWQAHSVRRFLSGTVKKRLGYDLISETSKDGVRRYRIERNKAAGRSTDG